MLRFSWLSKSFHASMHGNSIPKIFDGKLKILQRDVAAKNVELSRKTDYVRDIAATKLCERLHDIDRKFGKVLDFGANACNIARCLTIPTSQPVKYTPGEKIGQFYAVDASNSLLYRDCDLEFNNVVPIVRQVISSMDDVPDSDTHDQFDAVFSSMSLHWINNLPGVFSRIYSLLKPDCPFLAVTIGGDTLFELRTALQLSSVERLGGIGMHISPMLNASDLASLLQQTGYQLLTVDIEDVVIDYPDIFCLMNDLQAMGEQNALIAPRKCPLRRDVLIAADAIYRQLYSYSDSTIPATYRLIFSLGWKKGPNQPKPLSRGSGTINLKDALHVDNSSRLP